jgi:phospholipid/cholesterol/gamma-HCH transport system substrate-binding protein
VAKERRREVRVGIFVTTLLVVGAVLVFFVGGSTDLLERYYALNGAWADVSGMKEGAVVRLAGQDVGEVTAIRFSDDLGVKEVFVEMKVQEKYQARIREDSEARIDTVGVLGDKYVAISMGDPEFPLLDHGAWINTRPPFDMLESTKKVADILASTSNIGRKVDLMIGTDQEATKASLANSFEHVEKVLAEAETGDGLLHALVYDKGMSLKVDRTLANLEAMSTDIRATTNEIRHGEGIANELVFGDQGKDLALQLGTLATSLGTISSDLQNEDSLVHALLYEPEKAQIIDDLAAATSSLRETSEAINQGDGTIGMLARDPALYEDLRALVGGAQRNKLLRAYIRRTVRQGEEAQASPWEPASP